MGIDLANLRRSFTCAILDAAKHILFLGAVTPIEWQGLITAGKNILAAVTSPLTMNEGYMADPEYRRHLNIIPAANRFTELRVCEYELVTRGLSPTRSPRDVGHFTIGLQKALKFSSELGMNGFQYWPSPASARQMFETQADACFWSMLGVTPFPSGSLEGRLQRQLALQSKGLPIPDAMEFFEEITRHRLLSGKLPEEKILSAAELNALVAAYTAWVAGNRPAEHSRVGEPDEGVIILPVPTLPALNNKLRNK